MTSKAPSDDNNSIGQISWREIPHHKNRQFNKQEEGDPIMKQEANDDMQIPPGDNESDDPILQTEFTDEEDIKSKRWEVDKQKAAQYQVHHCKIWLLEDRNDIPLSNKRKYNISTYVGLISNKTHPVNGVFDAKAVPNHTSVDVLEED